MIKLFGRMIPAAARGLMRPRLSAAQQVSSRFRVLPHDIDINLHLNNGRYMQIIDVNRMEFLLRTGVARIIVDHGWKPILGSTTIQFRRELRLWEQAISSTRLMGWDARWVYLEHRIETLCGRPVAIAMAKAGFRHRGAWVPIETLRAALPFPLPDMALPAHVDAWRMLDEGLAAQIGLRRESSGSTGFDCNPELAGAEAAMVEDVVSGFEDAVREPGVAHALPDAFDRVEVGASHRQRQKGDVGGDDEPRRDVPACLVCES